MNFLIKGDDEVLHCISDSAGHVTVSRSYNQGTSNQPLANVRVTNVQGRILCILLVFMIYYLLIYHKLSFNLNNYDTWIKQCQFEFSTYLILICIVKICKVITSTKCELNIVHICLLQDKQFSIRNFEKPPNISVLQAHIWSYLLICKTWTPSVTYNIQ